MTKPVRVNTVISQSANEWLDKRSKETAITKSALINIAIDSYRKETEVISNLPELVAEFRKQGIKL